MVLVLSDDILACIIMLVLSANMNINLKKTITALTTKANKTTHTLSDGSFLRPALLTALLHASNNIVVKYLKHCCVDKKS